MTVRKRKAGDPLNIAATEWNALAEVAAGLVGQSRGPLGNAAQAVTVLVKNTTGVDLERYRCLSLGDPVWELQTDGSADLIFEGITADPDKPAAVLTEPIADDLFGRAWIYGLAYAVVGPGSGTSAAPNSTGNRLNPGGGNIRLLGSPSSTTELLLPVLIGVGGSGITDLRVQGNNLQFYKDGTWSTWHTGTTC